jgi:hypothetical protein
MNTHSRQRKGILRESLAVILVLALLAPGLAAGERRGNDVIVTKNDGKVVAGELLAVKGTDLLIMDGSTSAGITASLADVKSVKVIKNSKFLKGVGLGLLIGAPIGALVGAASGKTNPGWFEVTPGQGAVLGAVFFGGLSALVGGVFGAVAGTDKNVHVNSQASAELAYELRKYARDRS